MGNKHPLPTVAKEDLTPELLREFYSYDPATGLFSCACAPLPHDVSPIGYVRVRVFRQRYLAHRLAWFYTFGVWPRVDLDHINRDPSDNRIANLREAGKWLNALNRTEAPLGMSGIRGVTWCKRKGKWKAAIRHRNHHFNLGYFDEKHDAAAAFAVAAARFRGDAWGSAA